jgi:hypothetical protein
MAPLHSHGSIIGKVLRFLVCTWPILMMLYQFTTSTDCNKQWIKSDLSNSVRLNWTSLNLALDQPNQTPYHENQKLFSINIVDHVYFQLNNETTYNHNQTIQEELKRVYFTKQSKTNVFINLQSGKVIDVTIRTSLRCVYIGLGYWLRHLPLVILSVGGFSILFFYVQFDD